MRGRLLFKRWRLHLRAVRRRDVVGRNWRELSCDVRCLRSGLLRTVPRCLELHAVPCRCSVKLVWQRDLRRLRDRDLCRFRRVVLHALPLRHHDVQPAKSQRATRRMQHVRPRLRGRDHRRRHRSRGLRHLPIRVLRALQPNTVLLVPLRHVRADSGCGVLPRRCVRSWLVWAGRPDCGEQLLAVSVGHALSA